MKPLRHFGFLLWLALAIAMGQQAALRHELGHAIQRTQAPAKHQLPTSDTCEKCASFSAFHGGLLGAVQGDLAAPPKESFASFSVITAPRRTVVATRSRAPPALS